MGRSPDLHVSCLRYIITRITNVQRPVTINSLMGIISTLMQVYMSQDGQWTDFGYATMGMTTFWFVTAGLATSVYEYRIFKMRYEITAV